MFVVPAFLREIEFLFFKKLNNEIASIIEQEKINEFKKKKSFIKNAA